MCLCSQIMMTAFKRLPVVVVLGATGTGKSKLAIELGRYFNGEIISADSMQMYQSLDVITNKVTEEEQAQCVHHMLNVLSPLSPHNNVRNFRDMALPIIERLLNEEKVPIIVGGTNYYIEALMWNFLIDQQTVVLASCSNNPASTQPTTFSASFEEDSSQILQTKTLRDSSSLSGSKLSKSQTLSPYRKSTAASALSFWEPDEVNIHGGEGTEVSVSSDEDAESVDVDGARSTCRQQGASAARREKEGKYAEYSSTELHGMLEQVDPDLARRLHPQNRRRIVRGLQVFDDHGVPMSRVHRMQHLSGNTPGLSGALRYECCVFWLQTQQAELDKRLDERVDAMLKRGLVSELHSLHQHYLETLAMQSGEPDYTLGIFQSIGLKEFHEYLILPPEQCQSPEGQKLFRQGVEDLKTATRQYARKQLKWIKNRFLKRPSHNVPAVYGLDSTDVSQWSQAVLQPAIDILSAVIKGREVPVKPLSLDSESKTVHVQNVCHECDGRVFTTLHEWQIHLNSRKHKKMVQHKRRLGDPAFGDKKLELSVVNNTE